MKTLNCNGRLIDITTPRVMGILNITPDSFYEGSRIVSETDLLQRAALMLEQGALFLDVGGYSSRPGADAVSAEDEINRVVPAVRLLMKHFPEVLISVDTFRSEVAETAVEAGAVIVNDISAGLLDENMLPTIARLQVPYIMMHMRGTPQNMWQLTDYENITAEVIRYFSERINAARSLGINDLMVDPGFGFAKTITQNFELLSQLDLLQSFNLPVLVGLSRKSMIYKTLEIDPKASLNGTTALHSVALLKGVSILRVHDVKEAIECIRLVRQLNS